MNNVQLIPSRIALPSYAWLLIFVLLPTLIVVKISLSHSEIAQPPYTPVFDVYGGWAGAKAYFFALSFDNYILLWLDSLYRDSYLKSLIVATASTMLLLLIGYPVAYAAARSPAGMRSIVLMLIILPFWTAFLIRVYAWVSILQRDGLLNKLLLTLGIISEPIAWLASDPAVYIGIVYSYLPFMILPLYAVLTRIDDTLYEAAADLGATLWTTFWRITVPLSSQGILAGVLLCFIPIVGEFVIPDLLGSSSTMMIGQTLWTEFFANRDWPLASAVAVVMLVILLAPIALYQHLQGRALQNGQQA
jgi:putrescine transport system permease protein